MNIKDISKKTNLLKDILFPATSERIIEMVPDRRAGGTTALCYAAVYHAVTTPNINIALLTSGREKSHVFQNTAMMLDRFFNGALDEGILNSSIKLKNRSQILFASDANRMRGYSLDRCYMDNTFTLDGPHSQKVCEAKIVVEAALQHNSPNSHLIVLYSPRYG